MDVLSKVLGNFANSYSCGYTGDEVEKQMRGAKALDDKCMKQLQAKIDKYSKQLKHMANSKASTSVNLLNFTVSPALLFEEADHNRSVSVNISATAEYPEILYKFRRTWLIKYERQSQIPPILNPHFYSSYALSTTASKFPPKISPLMDGEAEWKRPGRIWVVCDRHDGNRFTLNIGDSARVYGALRQIKIKERSVHVLKDLHGNLRSLPDTQDRKFTITLLPASPNVSVPSKEVVNVSELVSRFSEADATPLSCAQPQIETGIFQPQAAHVGTLQRRESTSQALTPPAAVNVQEKTWSDLRANILPDTAPPLTPHRTTYISEQTAQSHSQANASQVAVPTSHSRSSISTASAREIPVPRPDIVSQGTVSDSSSRYRGSQQAEVARDNAIHIPDSAIKDTRTASPSHASPPRQPLLAPPSRNLEATSLHLERSSSTVPMPPAPAFTSSIPLQTTIPLPPTPVQQPVLPERPPVRHVHVSKEGNPQDGWVQRYVVRPVKFVLSQRSRG
ncbi:hypothetical protein BDW22DRAFT_338976 [Trametopsis cervina]|nr:hypothetical protein BDW22DRAFT_338976 [Trametopsis cervina]